MIRARIPGGLFSGGGGASVTTSDTPPASPSDGDLWWDSVLGKLFVWFQDPDSAAWVPATPSGSGSGGSSSSDVLDVRDHGVTMNGTTDDTAAVTAVVDIAAASRQTLYWPYGTALTTASIPLLHTVQHRGPGDIKRGSDVFAVEALDADTNKLYVAPAGVSTNDGLSSAQPTTPQAAANALVNYGPTLGGTWEIKFAAGSHPGVVLDSSLIGKIQFIGVPTGDFRSTPTSVIDKALSGAMGEGIYGSGAGKNITVKDIKAIGFNGVADSGFRFQQHMYVVFENVHTYDCYYGITAYSYVLYSMKGGILDGGPSGRYGINELWFIVRNFGVAAGKTNRTTLKNWIFGFHAKELCTGHADYLQITDCDYGMQLTRNSTANMADMDYRRNDIAVVLSGAKAINNSDINWHGHRLTAASWAAGVVTYTFALDAYGKGVELAVGEGFAITDCSPAGYNGSFVALSASTTVVTAAMVADPGAWASGGRIDANVIQILPLDRDIMDNAASGGNIEAEVLPPYTGQTSRLRSTFTVPFVLTGTTAITQIFYPMVGFMAGAFQAVGYEISLYAAGTYTITGASSTLHFRAGNTNIHYYVLPLGTKSWVMEARFIITETGNFQHHSGTLAVDGEPVQVKRGAMTLSLSTLEYNYGVSGQLTNAADTITGEVGRLYTTMM